MLEQYWSLAHSVERAYFESTAVQLGFGLCESVGSTTSAPDPSAPLRKRAAIAGLTAKPLTQPKKPRA